MRWATCTGNERPCLLMKAPYIQELAMKSSASSNTTATYRKLADTCSSEEALQRNKERSSERIRIGVGLLQERHGRGTWTRECAYSTENVELAHPYEPLTRDPNKPKSLQELPTATSKTQMAVHAIYINGAPFITPSTTLATDFRTWGHRVDTYQPLHHNILALRAMQDAEGLSQRERENELMDRWTAELVRRWGFVAPERVGALLCEREDATAREMKEEEGRWDFGAAVGMGRESFAESSKRERKERRMSRGGWAAWLGLGTGGRASSEVHGDVLPVYTKGEDPPAYER